MVKVESGEQLARASFGSESHLGGVVLRLETETGLSRVDPCGLRHIGDRRLQRVDRRCPERSRKRHEPDDRSTQSAALIDAGKISYHTPTVGSTDPTMLARNRR